MRIANSRTFRAALSCLCILSWTGALPAMAAPVAAPSTAPASTSPELDMLRRVLDVADAETRRPGADPSDTTAKAASLGFDPARIFAFVRDQVRVEPYRGLLRGPRGVLAGMSGNSLDRALLLQTLLTESGITCRLMRGTLPQPVARQVLDRFISAGIADPFPPSEPAQKADEQAVLLERGGVPTAVLKDVQDRAAARSAAFWQPVWPQVDDRVAFLTDTLNHSGCKPLAFAAIQADLLDALSTHYWVQRQDAGQWIDLDPILSDSQPGKTLAERGEPLTSPPADQRHVLEFSLVYRTQEAGAAKEQVLLAQTLEAATALFKPIAFSVQSADRDQPDPASVNGKGKIDLVRKMKLFQGLLRNGSQWIAGKPFDLVGNTYDVEPGGRVGTASSVGKGIQKGFGGFGAGLGGGGGNEEKKSTFIDLRVVLTLRSPGRKPITQTRLIVDGKQPAPPLVNWEVFLQPQPEPPALAGYQLIAYLAAQRPMVEAIVKRQHGAMSAGNPSSFPINSVPLVLMRNAALKRSLDGASNVVPLFDHPNLCIVTHRIGIAPDGAKTVSRWGVDLVEMGLTFVPRDAAAEMPAFTAAVRQGVAESTLEGAFLSTAFPGQSTSSAAGRFDTARLEGRKIQAVNAADIASIKSLGWTGDETSQEPADHLVIAPAVDGQDPVWWSVSPNGSVVARSMGGLGEAETDYMEVTLNVAGKVLCALEMLESMGNPKDAYALGSFLLCLAMQGGAWVVETTVEAHGVGMGLGMFDLAVWCLRGMNKPAE
jgi:hypothetical protein